MSKLDLVPLFRREVDVQILFLFSDTRLLKPKELDNILDLLLHDNRLEEELKVDESSFNEFSLGVHDLFL